MPKASAASSKRPISIPRAIEVFARGVTFTRSFTFPCVVHRVGALWVMRDAPRKREADYRREEWIAHDVPPESADAIIRKHARGRFCISAIHAADESDAPLRAGYKALGYRLGTTEPVFAHRLDGIPKLPQPFPIVRVTTQALADRLEKAAGRRQVLPEHFKKNSPLRQYTALDGEHVVGWVRSIDCGGATWVSNMHVLPKFRRRGIGKSLLEKMLRDDRAAGAKYSLLTASHTGAMLYPLVGYELIAGLLLYTPKRR
jgi:GNAT superfamily N-acetyltransferase